MNVWKGCKHEQCKLGELLRDNPLNSTERINQMQSLYSDWAFFEIQGKYTGNAWGDLVCLITTKMLSAEQLPYERVLPIFLNDAMSSAEQFHFIQDTFHILEEVNLKNPYIDFGYPSLRVHALCAAENCNLLPCCKHTKCAHSELKKARINTNFPLSQAIRVVSVLISTYANLCTESYFKHFPAKVWQENRLKMVKYLNTLSSFAGLESACAKALIKLKENLPMDLSEKLYCDFDLLKECVTDQQVMLDPLQLVLSTKNSILDHHESASCLVDASVNLLLQKNLPWTFISIKQMLHEEPRYLLFYLLVLYRANPNLQNEVNCLLSNLSQNSSKRYKVSCGSGITSKQIVLEGVVSTSPWMDEIKQILIDSIKGHCASLNFWKALTTNKLLNSLSSEPCLEVQKFRAFQGLPFDTDSPEVLGLYEGSDFSFVPNILVHPDSKPQDLLQMFCFAPVFLCRDSNFGGHLSETLRVVLNRLVSVELDKTWNWRALNSFVEVILKLVHFINFHAQQVFTQSFQGSLKVWVHCLSACWNCGFSSENTKVCLRCRTKLFALLIPKLPGPKCECFSSLTKEVLINKVCWIEDKLLETIELEPIVFRACSALKGSFCCELQPLQQQAFALVSQYAKLHHFEYFEHIEAPINQVALKNLEETCSALKSENTLLVINSVEVLLNNLETCNYKVLTLIVKALLFPRKQKEVASKCLFLLKTLCEKLQVSFHRLLSGVSDKYALKWLRQSAECQGFVQFLSQSFGVYEKTLLDEMILKTQPLHFCSQFESSLEILNFYKSISASNCIAVSLFYPNIISYLCFHFPQGMKYLEEVVSASIKHEGKQVSISQLYSGDQVKETQEVTLQLLLSYLGTVSPSFWFLSESIGVQVPVKVNQPQLSQVEAAFSKIQALFGGQVCMSQTVEKVSFTLRNLIQFGLRQNTKVFHAEWLRANSLIGFAELSLLLINQPNCFVYCRHKVISVCTQLIEFNVSAVVYLLERMLSITGDYESEISDVVALLYTANKSADQATNLINKICEQLNQRLSQLRLCYFIVLPSLLGNSRKQFPLLENYLVYKFPDPGDCQLELLRYLEEAIKVNCPILQLSAIYTVQQIVEKLSVEQRQNIAISLNLACSYQTSRDDINEFPVPLGKLIDETLGKVGALSYTALQDKILTEEEESKGIDLRECFVQTRDLYTSSEFFFIAFVKYQEFPQEFLDEIDYEDFEENYFWSASQNTDPCYFEKPSLRDWTIHLIAQTNEPRIQPLIPLIHFNLQLVTSVLPELFRCHEDKFDYLTEYILEFLKNATPGHKRLMLKVLLSHKSIWENLPPMFKIELLTELKELPLALCFLESHIWKKFRNQRYSPKLLSKEELEQLAQVYWLLVKERYLEALPCTLVPFLAEDPQTAAQVSYMKKGNFLAIVAPGFPSNWRVSAAGWRVGCFFPGPDHFEVSIAEVLNCFQVYSSTSNSIEKERRKWIGKSMIRAAAYTQAYHHILLQHIFENIKIFEETSDLAKLIKRNKCVEKKFEYRELVDRVSLALARISGNSKLILTAFRVLVKNCIRFGEIKYAKNLLLEMKSLHPYLSSPLFTYYKAKLALKSGTFSNQLKVSLKKHSQETHTAAGIHSQELREKFLSLCLKAHCYESPELSESKLKKLSQKYISAGSHLEKRYYILASTLDKHYTFSKSIQENLQLAEMTCQFYCKALGDKHYIHTMTRALSLYFEINRFKESSQLHNMFQDMCRKQPLYVWGDRVHQVLAEFSHPVSGCRLLVTNVFSRLLLVHPQQMSWFLFSFTELEKPFSNQNPREKFFKEILRIYKTNAGTPRAKELEKCKDFFKELVKLAKTRELNQIPQSLLRHKNLPVAMPITRNFQLITSNPQFAFTPSPTCIHKVDNILRIMQSKAKPKRIVLEGTDGVQYYFLCKYETGSDMRKEARIVNIIHCVDRILQQDDEIQRLGIRLPSYMILAVNPSCAIVEWIENTETLKTIIHEIWKNEKLDLDIQKVGRNYYTNGRDISPENWQKLNSENPVSLQNCFFEFYKPGNEWLKVRTNFARSLAAWSMLGFVIGLGDRHCDNILLIETTGELLFIDFECVFGMGKILPKPEVVPFRLTPEFQAAMGLFHEEGEFLNSAAIVLAVLQKHKYVLLSQFESFVSDPIGCDIRNPDISPEDRDLRNTIKVVESRLENKPTVNSRPFNSTRRMVKHLVNEATDSENLRKMFIGWSPWM